MRVQAGPKPVRSRDLTLRRLHSRGDTEYLLGNPEMAARLRRAREDAASGRARELTLDEFYARSGREPEA
jgi:hypothetical protein